MKQTANKKEFPSRNSFFLPVRHKVLHTYSNFEQNVVYVALCAKKRTHCVRCVVILFRNLLLRLLLVVAWGGSVFRLACGCFAFRQIGRLFLCFGGQLGNLGRLFRRGFGLIRRGGGGWRPYAFCAVCPLVFLRTAAAARSVPAAQSVGRPLWVGARTCR